MSHSRRRFTRSEALEILTGVVLMVGALAWWNLPAGVFAAGLFLTAGSLYGRTA